MDQWRDCSGKIKLNVEERGGLGRETEDTAKIKEHLRGNLIQGNLFKI